MNSGSEAHHLEKNEVRCLSLAYKGKSSSYHGQSKWIKGLNVKGKITKFTEENTE